MAYGFPGYPGAMGAAGDVRTGESPLYRGFPTMVGPRDLRFEQVIAGSTPLSAVQNGLPPDSYEVSHISRWPGRIATIGRQHNPALGAMWGAKSAGFWQSACNRRLPPPAIPWVYAMARQLRTLSQPFNRTTSNQAIPSVFVPTSASNFYGQLGS